VLLHPEQKIVLWRCYAPIWDWMQNKLEKHKLTLEITCIQQKRLDMLTEKWVYLKMSGPNNKKPKVRTFKYQSGKVRSFDLFSTNF